MSTIHGVNVGGSLYNVSDSSNVAPLEQTMFATRDYGLGRCMILADGLLYRAKEAISSGDPLVINGNIKRTTVDEIVDSLETDSDLIAPTEDGDTSSDDYSIGAQIARSGLLYKVIDDISEGDAFVVGNNIELAGNVTSQLYAVNRNLKNLSGRNLLDNPWFTINQRGFTSKTNGTGYCVDRWNISYCPNGVVSYADGILTVTDTASSPSEVSVEQNFEKNDIAGKVVTGSILFSDGTIETGTITFPETEGSSDKEIISKSSHRLVATWRASRTCGVFFAVKTGNTKSIKALKLELGSISTLANDVAPNYAEELAKCQRYFVNLNAKKMVYATVGTAIEYSTTGCGLVIPLPTSMRDTPTISFNGTLNIWDGAAHATTTPSLSVDNTSESSVYVTCNSGFTGLSNRTGYAYLSGENSYINLSADL